MEPGARLTGFKLGSVPSELIGEVSEDEFHELIVAIDRELTQLTPPLLTHSLGETVSMFLRSCSCGKIMSMSNFVALAANRADDVCRAVDEGVGSYWTVETLTRHGAPGALPEYNLLLCIYTGIDAETSR